MRMKETNFELVNSREEKETEHFTIDIEISRHAEKAGGNVVPQAEDEKMPLSPKGRLQSRALKQTSKLKDAVPVGSPRARTGETSLHKIHGNSEFITGNETYEELLAKAGGKPWTNRRLDMPLNKDEAWVSEISGEPYEKGIYLKNLAHLSDEARRTGVHSKASDLYGNQARNIALLLQTCSRVANKMADRALYERPKVKKYSDLVKNREYAMTTHAGVSESFFAEVLRHTNGEAERQRFFDAVPNGFSFGDTAHIRILGTSGGGEPALHITFTAGKGDKKYSYDKMFSSNVLTQIISDFSPKEHTGKGENK